MLLLQDLVQRIIQRPDEIALRREYASLVEPANPAYAAFIRDQIWLAQRGRQPGNADWLQRSRSTAEAELRHGREWAPPVLRSKRRYPRIAYRSGFVETIETAASRLLADAGELFRSAPIRYLILTGAKKHLPVLAGLPAMRSILALDLTRCDLEDSDLELLCSSPNLAGLRWLSLAGNRITRHGAEALAVATKSGGLRHLGYVDWGGNPFNPCDRPVWDQDLVVDLEQPPGGRELEAAYGHLPWLHRQVTEDGLLDYASPL
ncbi:MAG: hypothetical protein R2762_08395 [Bryobacteraceae bacterium]